MFEYLKDREEQEIKRDGECKSRKVNGLKQMETFLLWAPP